MMKKQKDSSQPAAPSRLLSVVEAPLRERRRAGKTGGGSRNNWHPAFRECLELELEQYSDALQFEFEHPLTDEPLVIDALVIKKVPGAVIEKNIGALFRAVNIVEYKSPGDYLSVRDYYKVYAYACLYISQEQIAATDVTLTFVSERHPREVIKHLKKTYGYTVDEQQNGIYYVRGSILPIQIIETMKLSEEENLWLRCLSDSLDARSIRTVLEESAARQKTAKVRAYLHVLLKANAKMAKEAMVMKKERYTIEQAFIDTGWAAKWEADGIAVGEERGRENGIAIGEERGAYQAKLEAARNLLSMGCTAEFTAQATGLSLDKIVAS
jgi:hypothetical protein